MASGYVAEITNSSSDFKGKAKLEMTTFTDCVGIDEMVQGTPLIISPDEWAMVHVTNERNKGDKEYDVMVIKDVDGTKYKTSSENFMDEFLRIYDIMKDEDEDWAIKAIKKPSGNYAGKTFLTCAVC